MNTAEIPETTARKQPSYLFMGCLAVMLIHATPLKANDHHAIQLKDVTTQTDVDFIHTDGSSGRRYIVETVASGLATFDFDGDGLIDILFLNGAPLPGATPPVQPRNALYRNEGHWKFTDVTTKAGLDDSRYHLGVCVGDYDNDGHLDIFLNNFGPNILYRNNGDSTFTDVTHETGLGTGQEVGAGACFLDADGDGDLDLFIAQYVGFGFDKHHISQMNGFPAYVGPLNYPPTTNAFYRNNGNGTFTDVSRESGIGLLKGAGMGVIACDLDNDRDTDIIVGNDLRPDFVLRNDGHGKFREEGTLLGLAYDAFGNVQGSMGVECADWNHDGWMDVYITPYQRQIPTLFQSQKGLFFEDVSRQTGAGKDAFADVKWGVGIIDFDNDTHRDLFIATGHLIDNVEQIDSSMRYAASNILLRNTGTGKFVNVSEQCGDGMQPVKSSRGAAFDDLDNDGDIDAVILNARSSPTLIRNDSGQGNHWLQIQLQGTTSNRDGIGARVTVRTGKLQQIDEIHSGRSYQSDFGKRLHFGLGNQTHIDEIKVEWIGGDVDTLHHIQANQLCVIKEGQGLTQGRSSDPKP
tara:strand:+ start:1655 stop:3385 length:1731 start_codon:yes stop_codon:yes gene_type:complete